MVLRFPLSGYRALAEEIRPLVQRVDIFDALCRGGAQASVADWREACRRRGLVKIELERRDWCHLDADRGWERCSSHDDYRPGQVAAYMLQLFSEASIRWLREQERRHPDSEPQS